MGNTVNILLKPLEAYLYQAHLRGAFLREGSHLIYQNRPLYCFQNKSKLPAHHSIDPTRLGHMNNYCNRCHKLIQSIIHGSH